MSRPSRADIAERCGEQRQMSVRQVSRSKKALVTSVLTVVLSAGTSVALAPAAFAANIVGTPGVDTLRGTEEADTIDGLAGVDDLIGLGGDDVLVGGPGVDGLFGGVGNDLLDGGQGVDYLFGGDGADDLRGGDGVDHLIGVGDGVPDTIDGGDGTDSAWAGPEDVRGAGIEYWYVNETPPCERSQPAESPVGCNTLPGGVVYDATASTIRGYAFDRDIAGEVDVHLYQTPPGGSAQFLAAVRTTPPPDFFGWTPEPANFTFAHALPPGTTVQAYVINVDLAGQPAGPNPLIGTTVVP
jgi:hypothetical protein